MSPKVPFSPRIYWLIFTLTFFLLLGCSYTKSLLRKGENVSGKTAILYNKYPKKLNSKFYAEGSSYYRFIERNLLSEDRKVIDWELTFLVFEKEFVNSVKAEYPNADTKLYKILWRKKQGTYVLADNKKDFIANYTSLTLGETKADSLNELAMLLKKENGLTTKIQESANFFINDEIAYQVSESITVQDSLKYEWKNEISTSESTPSRSAFVFTKSKDKPIKFISPHYDYLQLQLQVIPIEPKQLFYKTIFSDEVLELFFLPPLTNDMDSKPKEPIGFKRFGNYLLDEVTP